MLVNFVSRCSASTIIRHLCLAILVATILTGTAARALAQQFQAVNFSNQANFTWVGEETDPSGLTGIYFPGGPAGQVTLGSGIPFNISSNAAGYQAWNAYFAAGGTSSPVSITIPVGVYGVTNVYTLINTYWLLPGPSSDASVIFTGSSGATYTKALVGNTDIRGWCCSGAINNTTTINIYTESASPINGAPAYLDMQNIALPSEFATQTLTTIQVVDDGAPGVQRVILDGVTVESTPIVPTFTTLASFDGTDGYGPDYMALVQGTDGNFYGTTYNFGVDGFGTIFNITPAGTLTDLYNFMDGVDGGYPYAGLVLAPNGNFYGAAASGGANGMGSVYEVTPSGTLTTLYSFTGGPDGGGSNAPLALGANGNLYGTAACCAAYRNGVVFEITPGGTFTTLHTFTGGADGGIPLAGLVQAANGNFYGTTYDGGSGDCSGGCGTVFKITPGGVLTTVYTFSGASDGGNPQSGLALGTNGSLYGTTSCCGNAGFGTVFQVTPSGVFTPLYSFSGGADGAYPFAAVIQANDGNFYGTTAYGGSGSGYNGSGTVFQITPQGSLTTLHTFTGPDGANPHGGLLQGTGGSFYGATVYGGPSNAGTVFNLSTGLNPLVKAVPDTGAVGSTVLILGSNLSGAANVTFNGMAADFSIVSPTEISTTVPAGASTGALLVAASGGAQLSGGPFFVVPAISSFSPTSGPVGTVVTIDGETLTGTTGVTFGGVPAASFTVKSYTQITATVPAGAKTGSIGVTTPIGTATSASHFDVRNATATALSSSPNPSTYGQSVTFTATVSSSGPTPTGTVEFLYGSSPLGAGALSAGVATFTTIKIKLPVGMDSITAVYGGDAHSLGSTSNTLDQTVNKD